MIASTAERFLAHNAQVAGQWQQLGSTTLAGVEKLVLLQIGFVRSLLSGTGGDLIAIANADSASNALAAQAALVKPLLERSITFMQEAQAISVETGNALHKTAQTRLLEDRQDWAAAWDALAAQAPTGSESVFQLVKSTLQASHCAMDGVENSTRQALELAQQQAAALTASALRTVRTAARKK
ncbi:MAG: phasin family protein [Rhodoferax sp.]